MSLKKILSEITKQFLKEIGFLSFDDKYYNSAFKNARIDLFRNGELTYKTSFKGMQLPEQSPIPSMFEDAHLPSTSSPKTKDMVSYITPREFIRLSSKGNVNSRTLDYWLKKYREEDTIRFNDVPFFQISERVHDTFDFSGDDVEIGSENAYTITGHEGRHRSLIMILMGFGDELMPVRITSYRIRFKEQLEDPSQITVYPQSNARTNEKHTFKFINN